MGKIVFINENNWGFNITESPEGVHTLVNIAGCNQTIRVNGYEGQYAYLHTFIPKKYADWSFEQVSKFIPGYSFGDFINLANKAGFTSYPVTDEKRDELVKELNIHSYNDFKGNSETFNSDDFYCVKIPMKKCDKTGYYAFCFYRHLYYMNKYMYRYIIDTMQIKDPIELVSMTSFYGMYGSNSLLYRQNSYVVSDYFTLCKTNDNTYIGWITPNFNYQDYYLSPVKSSIRVTVNNSTIFQSTTMYAHKKDPKNIYQEVTIEGSNKYITAFIVINNLGSAINQTNINSNKYFIQAAKPEKMAYSEIRSRHPSHNIFRKNPLLNFNKSVLIRLGSTTPTKKNWDVEINSIDSINKSSDKLLMKHCFDDEGVRNPLWFVSDSNGTRFFERDSLDIPKELSELPFPIIAKHRKGSRGTGNYKLDTPEALIEWLRGKNLSNYIFEKFYNYAKEYRVHVSKYGAFLTWRKLRRSDTPEDRRWFFNNENCNWVSPANELFDMPSNFKEIQNECVKALKAVGLTIGGCDVRVTSNAKGEPKYVIIEINSACSQAEQTSEAYVEEFRKIVKNSKK